MNCKYGFYTCCFTGQVDFCVDCDEGNNYQMKEEKRGGAGRGQGRHKKEKPLQTKCFRVDGEAYKKAKELHGKTLSDKVNNFIIELSKLPPR